MRRQVDRADRERGGQMRYPTSFVALVAYVVDHEDRTCRAALLLRRAAPFFYIVVASLLVVIVLLVSSPEAAGIAAAALGGPAGVLHFVHRWRRKRPRRSLTS